MDVTSQKKNYASYRLISIAGVLSLNLGTIGLKFQYPVNTIIVVLLTIFPIALVALNSVQRVRSNRQISTAARLG